MRLPYFDVVIYLVHLFPYSVALYRRYFQNYSNFTRKYVNKETYLIVKLVLKYSANLYDSFLSHKYRAYLRINRIVNEKLLFV